MKIRQIKAEQIFDSRGNPTLNVTVFTESGQGSFAVPSGASTGAHEAHELRDENGGVKKAIRAVEEINSVLVGLDVAEQEAIDKKMIELDGILNKERLGANSLIGVSVACAKAAAAVQGKEVYEYLRGLVDIKPSRPAPYLFMNLINGGKHTRSQLAFQEYMVAPMVDNAVQALEIGQDIFKALEEDLGENYGDEGGYIIDSEDVIEPLRALKKAAQKTGRFQDVKFALDVAASSLAENYTPERLFKIYSEMIGEFPMLSIEDPFREDDFKNFAKLRKEYPELLVVGDDLTVTNPERLKKAIEEKSISAVIIKPNQIGTLSETLETMKLARENNIECIVSHRSGETKDNFIADLACAFGCFGLKSGAPRPPERIVKYNRLVEIVGENRK